MTSTPTPGSPSGSSPGSSSSTPQNAAQNAVPEQPTFDAVCAASPLVQAALADTVRTLHAAGTFGASTENVESRTLLAPLVASVTATSGRTIVALKVLILGSTADTSTGRSEPLVSVTYRDTTASTYAFTLAPAVEAIGQTRTETGAPAVDAAVSPAPGRRRREPATTPASAVASPSKPHSRRAAAPSVAGRFDLTSRPRLLCFAPALALLGWLLFTCIAIRLDLSWREDRLAPDEDLALAGIAYLYPIVVSLLAFPAAAIPVGYAWLRRPDDVLRRVGSWGSALICGPVLAFALLHLLSLNGILARLAALPALLILAVPVTAAARVAIAETAGARQQTDGTEQA